MATISAVLNSLNRYWLGFRFILVPSLTNAENFTSDKGFIDTIGLASLGISEVIPPETNISLTTIPSLSNVKRYIPHNINTGQLILKSPTFKNWAFYDRIVNQKRALLEEQGYYSTETLMLIEYETNPGEGFGIEKVDSIIENALEPLNAPLAIWTFTGCQATKHITPPANTNGFGQNPPLEELHLQVDSVERLSF